ncbi:MAG: Uma2 family endonuclease [Verrucomicrobiales bacterium]|nr:Uma2 family endonuclease [Verrucomicrobiales bacterium]
MQAIVERKRRHGPLPYDPPPLENGARLTAREFLRRYEAMPDLKKAELIAGIVYMPPPVSADHSEPDNLIQTWLGTYAAATPGVRCYTNTTVLLGPRNTPQPDACLCVKPGRGGQTRFNEKNYLVGAPELIAEVAATSASLDLGDKLEAYAMAGVREYVVWRTLEAGIDWFKIEDAEYVAVRPDARGLIRSGVFPGLILDVNALLTMKSATVLAVLRRGLASTAHRTFTARLR